MVSTSSKGIAKGPVKAFSLMTDYDIYLFKSGRHYRLYEKLGSHEVRLKRTKGTLFAVWAPNAVEVSVMGDFNGWANGTHKLFNRWDGSGIWEGFVPGVQQGELYKYCIVTREGESLEKSDPFAFHFEQPPATASIVHTLDYRWGDSGWMKFRLEKSASPKPMSVYEVHLGSWKKKAQDGERAMTYLELAVDLVGYVKEMGFTHVEFMPVMEHPFYGSWGYQVTGYFAPTSRYGKPEDLMALIDAFHQEGIGVILDWVPSHFPNDAFSLYQFDGTCLFEHEDLRKGFHPDWQSCIFNYGRHEVKAFLISSAMFWLDRYHADGIRVDAVASMLYLDYSRKEGEWVPNQYGGRENIEAIEFLKELNETVYREYPAVITVAEESTSWAGVSRPTYSGGLGFGQKWMMGWMHDTLCYFMHDPVFRSYHQNEITFSILYAFTENFMLPLSHDEVVHGKGSLLSRMPGDEWQRFANLRLLYTYMFTHPGTKLLFMGNEWGQSGEWRHDHSLEWGLLQYGYHQGVQRFVKALNTFYKEEPALWHYGFDHKGFEWIDYADHENSVIAYLRKDDRDLLLVICNFTPVVRYPYQVGVPREGRWKEVFNSDALEFMGSGQTHEGLLEGIPGDYHGRGFYLTVKVPPLACLVLKWIG